MSIASPAPGRWTTSHEKALADVSRWMRGGSATGQVYRLFGYAGVGKSTLVKELVAGSPRPWLFASYTGKAALVMRQKGCAGAQTIHSLIYRPSGEVRPEDGGRAQPTFRLHDDSPLRWAPGVVLDECSMIDEEMATDLLSFGKKILVCGDPAQLPPVSGGGYFTTGQPDFLLTEVHRQARESGILDLATFVREGGNPWTRVGWSTDDCAVVPRGRGTGELWGRMVNADQVLVGLNRTRHMFNARYRKLLHIESPWPVPDDKVVCLRNERRVGLFNGSMWRVGSALVSDDERIVDLDLTSEDATMADVSVKAWTHHFAARERELDDLDVVRLGRSEFDYGYNITCHKSQGSQWDDVVLFDESRSFDADTARRWLYTGVTRAARKLLVVV